MRSSRQLALVLIAAAFAVPVHAATWLVPSECPTIQAGIDAASYGDTVLVACGMYYEHDIIMKSGVCLTSETGEPGCAVIDAQQQGRGIRCDHVDEVAIQGFTITHGVTETWGPWYELRGGGILCIYSEVRLSDLVLESNSADVGGAAAYFLESDGAIEDVRVSDNHAPATGGVEVTDSSVTLTRVEFTGNTSVSASAGLVCSGNPAPTLVDCLFAENHSNYGWGGGMGIYDCAPELDGCIFSLNHAEGRAGGLLIHQSSPQLHGCRFMDNEAESGGGAVCIEGSPTFVECIFSENAAGDGGGIEISGSTTVSLTDCTFTGNSATVGGAARLNDGSFLATRCVFSGNTAVTLGGGIACSNAAATTLTSCALTGNSSVYRGGAVDVHGEASLAMDGCTLSGNSSLSGGGVASDSSVPVVMERTIIAFSTEGEAALCTGDGSMSLACCDVVGNAGGDWVGCIADQYDENANFSADPLFCLEDNPGEPYSLHEGSPCLPANSPCGELVGTFGQGCGAVTVVEAVSWGAIKAMFR